MRASDTRLQHLSNALAIGTGAAYAGVRYFVRPADPYSNATSPWEPLIHNLHIVTVPLLVFACGMIWHNHILPGWRKWNDGSWGFLKSSSGLTLFLVLSPMIGSGYLIQVTVDDFWRTSWVWIHLLASGVWAFGYLLHLPRPRAKR